MSSPPPWVQDGARFSLTSPTNSLMDPTALSPTPSSSDSQSLPVFSPVHVPAQLTMTDHRLNMTSHLHSSQSSGSMSSDRGLGTHQTQPKRSPKDHWLILPPEFQEAKQQSSNAQSKTRGQGNGTEQKPITMETEFPVDNSSPRVKGVAASTTSAAKCDGDTHSKEEKDKSNLSEEKLAKDLEEKENLAVKDKKSTDDVSPGQELLKLTDSFTEKYVIDKNDGLPHIKPQLANTQNALHHKPSGIKSNSRLGTSPSSNTQNASQQAALLDSDSDDSDSVSHAFSHDFSCASTVSLNELLEKELDEMETPMDEDFSVNNLPIYMVEDMSIDDFDDFADIGDNAKQIHDQCLVERKFEIRDGVLVARSVIPSRGEEALCKKQANNNSSLMNHNEKGTLSPERPSSLKLGNGALNDTSCAECNSGGSHSSKDTVLENAKGESPPKVFPKSKKKGLNSNVEKCRNGGVLKGTQHACDVTPVMVASSHSNSSSSPDSAMQGSFTSTSSSDVPEKMTQRTDDGYSSNSTVSTSLTDLHRDPAGTERGRFSRTPSGDTRSTMSTPHSDVPSVVGRNEPMNSSRERKESQCSATSHSSVESSPPTRKVRDMRAYFEQRVEELTLEVNRKAAAAAAATMATHQGHGTTVCSIPQVPNFITIEPKLTESADSATMMFSSCDSEAMSSSFIVKKTNSSLESSDMSNSQKTLTPPDSEGSGKTPLSPSTNHKRTLKALSLEDLKLVQDMKPHTERTLKHSLSDANISQGKLVECPGYLKSLHSQLARIYCLAESLRVSVIARTLQKFTIGVSSENFIQLFKLCSTNLEVGIEMLTRKLKIQEPGWVVQSCKHESFCGEVLQVVPHAPLFQESSWKSCKSEAHLERFTKICTEDSLLEMKISLKKEWLKRYGSHNEAPVQSHSTQGQVLKSCLKSPEEVRMSLLLSYKANLRAALGNLWRSVTCSCVSLFCFILLKVVSPENGRYASAGHSAQLGHRMALPNSSRHSNKKEVVRPMFLV